MTEMKEEIKEETKIDINQMRNDMIFKRAMDHAMTWEDLYKRNEEQKDKKALIMLPVPVRIQDVDYQYTVLVDICGQVVPQLVHVTEGKEDMNLCLSPEVRQFVEAEVGGKTPRDPEMPPYESAEEMDRLLNNLIKDGHCKVYRKLDTDHWSQQRAAILVAQLLKSSNDLRFRSGGFCGDRLFVGEDVATVLDLSQIYHRKEEDGMMGLLNGVIRVYLVPSMPKNMAVMSKYSRGSRYDQLVIFEDLKFDDSTSEEKKE